MIFETDFLVIMPELKTKAASWTSNETRILSDADDRVLTDGDTRILSETVDGYLMSIQMPEYSPLIVMPEV